MKEYQMVHRILGFFVPLTIFSSCLQSEQCRADFYAVSVDEPTKKISHNDIQRSSLLKRLTRHNNSFAFQNNTSNSSYNLVHNPRACASWKVADYWNAALELFGRAYPRGVVVTLPPEYKCFCTDDNYQYYIHDQERYYIMEQWQLYDYSEFWSFIQNYPDYEQCIMAIHDIMSHDRSMYDQLSPTAIDRIKSEVSKIALERQQREAVIRESQRRSCVREAFSSHINNLHQEAYEQSQLASFYARYDFETEYLEKRRAALDDIRQRGAFYEIRSYAVSPHLEEILGKKGYECASYKALYGNQVQQLVHQDCITLAEKICIIPDTSFMYEQKDALVDCIDAARDYNQAGLTHKAVIINDFCRSLLDYGTAILTGATQGIVAAVRDCSEHPIQTALCVAAGEYVLAYQLCKVMFNVAEIGITSLHNVEKGIQKWNDFVEPISNIIDALYNKEVSLRDAAQGVTQFAFHWKAQNKLLGGLGKFYKATKAKALAFAEKNQLSSPEHYLATPEGHVFRVHGCSEKITQNSERLRESIGSIENSAHNAVYYENLKKVLREEQYTSIIKCTKHGLESLMKRFIPEEVSAIINGADFIKIQNDGARALIKKVNENYAIITINPETNLVITGINNLNYQSLVKLGKNYGWEL